MMAVEMNNLGTLTPIHTDFGSNRSDLLVVEYDVPQTKVKQTLFYKYGQLSIPKWALIPAGILIFGLLTALFAVIVNSILSQPTIIVTYSQKCSQTSKCNVGLICGSESKCTCPSKQYWYENTCVNQPTYTEQCNQTSECRTDLGLVCAEIDGQCNCPNITKAQTCDCPSTSYWTGSMCTNRLSDLDACSVVDTSYQCISNLYCNGTMCICAPNTQYWNSTANECYSVDKYLALCDPVTSYSCDASALLFCLAAGEGAQCPFNATANSTSCDCANGTYWTGGSCATKKTINAACFWNCECNSDVGLQCLNMSCVCPNKYSWSTSTSPSSCVTQKTYTQSPCYNTSECDSTQGLTCYLSGSECNCPSNSSIHMCDCLTSQYYDYNLTSCQTLQLYNETCYGNYMCDSTLGLFCQMSINNATNCSCPEPIRLNMCDCNITSYWNGVTCTTRLTPNISCSLDYQCQEGFICIVNETSIGIFSDVCRCPLGYYYVAGSGCVPSKNYTDLCVGSYQCYELAPLSCRYNDTGLTCLDSGYTLLPACDCQDNYFYNKTTGLCSPLLGRLASCDADCECISPYECSVNNQCDCPLYYSSLSQSCVNFLGYGDQCSNAAECQAAPNALMTCVSGGTCGCNQTEFWTGSQCSTTINFRAICQSDLNCFNGLVCQKITCIDSNKRCSCPSNHYYSPSSQSCMLCSGSYNNYERYVINYPNSDLCVAIRVPSTKASSISFTTADTDCTTLTPIVPGISPQLISVHNTSQLNCIAELLNSVASSVTCSNRWYYLGLNSTSMVFYDGTSYYAAFTSPLLNPFECLTYCLSSGITGQLSFNPCSGTSKGYTYGAICDYRIV